MLLHSHYTCVSNVSEQGVSSCCASMSSALCVSAANVHLQYKVHRGQTCLLMLYLSAGVVLPNRLLQMPFQVTYAKFISGDFIPKGRSFVLIAELSSERLAVGYAKTSLDMVSEPPVRWTACHLSGLHVLLCMCYRGQAEGICGPNGPCGR